MGLKQAGIGRQLKQVFLILGIIFGLISMYTIWQTGVLSNQTELLYKHPLQVRRTLDEIQVDQQKMSLALRDMILAGNGEERNLAYERLVRLKPEIPNGIEKLRELYLGPTEDIDAIETEYLLWEEVLFRSASAAIEGDITVAQASIQSGGDVEKLTLLLLEQLESATLFATQKADELYLTSMERQRTISLMNFTFVGMMLLGMYIVSTRIYGNIQRPLQDLVGVIQRVEGGSLSTRSSITDKNEFGTLAEGLNQMLDSIENSVTLNGKSAALSEIMLASDEMQVFFTSLLAQLLKSTGGHLGGIYLLSEDKTQYDLYASIGMEKAKRMSFDRESLEGELGIAGNSGEILLLKELSENTQFALPTATGLLMPKEMLTIPIVNQEEVFAFVTLGSISGFDDLTVELLEKERAVISARIQSVLDLDKIKVIKSKLEIQNSELETQKTELDALSMELGEQNRELEQQKDELSEANRLKTNFLSNMSHELRTPLNSVIALTGVLERRLKGKITEEESTYLEVIGRSGKTLLEMINEILDISRIESGREELEIRRFDMDELIQEIVAMLNPVTQEKGVELNYQVIGSSSEIVMDEKKIRHIVQNLMSNAVKFTASGEISVVARIGRDTLQLEVADTGIGIAKENHESIFEEFRQADSSTTRMYGGTGLGLAIAKKYVEFLGGKISLSSKIGEGSVFTVEIPLPDFPEERVNESEWTGRSKPWKNLKNIEARADQVDAQNRGGHLLIVEDSEPSIIQLQDVFSQVGYRVTIARDGLEAIALIGNCKPDGIILDLMMPKADGFEVLRTIRENISTVKIPVLVLSAKQITQEELSRLKHNRVYQLIQKGNVNLDDLKHAVDSMLHPIEEVAPQKKEAPSKKRAPIPVSKPLILVVEDNPDNRMTARAVLEEHYTIIEAETGEEALVMTEENIPDLILMDNALPGMDGVDTFKAIKKNDALAHIPVIALTASAMVTDREIFLAYGFDGFVSKPIIEVELLKAIKGVLYGY